MCIFMYSNKYIQPNLRKALELKHKTITNISQLLWNENTASFPEMWLQFFTLVWVYLYGDDFREGGAVIKNIPQLMVILL